MKQKKLLKIRKTENLDTFKEVELLNIGIYYCECAGEDCFNGRVLYKLNRKKYECDFLFNPRANYKVCFVNVGKYGNTIPNDRVQAEALLSMIYGQVMKYICVNELNDFFEKRLKEEKYQALLKKQEEERKKIALGEQITIDKYLANKE